jgi:hypothetical protein
LLPYVSCVKSNSVTKSRGSNPLAFFTLRAVKSHEKRKMVLETLAGGVLGGVFRLFPEVLKVFDAKNSRKHELALLEAEMKFASLRAEHGMRQAEAAMTVAELDAVSEAIQEQGQTSRAAGWFVAAISALVRPLVTYWFVGLYSAVKIVSMWLAVQAGEAWESVIIRHWTSEDMSLLVMILTFWFVGRVFERTKS